MEFKDGDVTAEVEAAVTVVMLKNGQIGLNMEGRELKLIEIVGLLGIAQEIVVSRGRLPQAKPSGRMPLVTPNQGIQ
ncbi:MAG: hypothetical protein WC241_04940 [Candidatus Paceibacterota bacterium]|jgi:hypothetical protein